MFRACTAPSVLSESGKATGAGVHTPENYAQAPGTDWPDVLCVEGGPAHKGWGRVSQDEKVD